MATIELQHLSKHFGALTAVNNVDLSVAAGEVLCLLGPSGCGKTTTLRMIAGLETASSGDVLLAGRRVNDLATRDRNVAMAFQFYALYPSLSVAENLAYPLHAEKTISASEIKERVNATAKTLELDQLLDRRPNQLAEGEKQRVAVGRAIIRDPNCFLFDEPLSRLDVELRQTMRGQIKAVLAGLSKATVIVTHDQLEALTMADRIAVMRAGIIEQVATPHAIFAQPSNVFVAGFIGTPQMNLLGAELIEHASDTSGRANSDRANSGRASAGRASAGRARFQIGSQQLWLDVNPGVMQLAPNSRVTIGIRPRSFELSYQDPDDNHDSLSAVVDIIEPMGAETLFHLLEDGNDVRVVLRRDVTPVPAIGERIGLRCKPGQAHIFNDQGELVQHDRTH